MEMAFAEALFLLQKPFFGLQSPSLPLENCQKLFWPLNLEIPSAKVKREVPSPARDLSLFLLLLLLCSRDFSSAP